MLARPIGPLLAAALLACGGAAATAPPTNAPGDDMPSTPSVELAERWRGHAHLGTTGEGVETFVIRDTAGYDAFVDRIPRDRVQMKQPAPPSDDPLLAKPPIDFTTSVLVVIIRGDSLSAPEITGLDTVGDLVRLRYRVPPPPPEARPSGIGGYVAARIGNHTGPVELAAEP